MRRLFSLHTTCSCSAPVCFSGSGRLVFAPPFSCSRCSLPCRRFSASLPASVAFGVGCVVRRRWVLLLAGVFSVLPPVSDFIPFFSVGVLAGTLFAGLVFGSGWL
jgi:hypothetical protein